MQFRDPIVVGAVILILLAAIIVLILLFRRTRRYREIVFEIVPPVPASSIRPRRWRVAVLAVLGFGLVYASFVLRLRARQDRTRTRVA